MLHVVVDGDHVGEHHRGGVRGQVVAVVGARRGGRLAVLGGVDRADRPREAVVAPEEGVEGAGDGAGRLRVQERQAEALALRVGVVAAVCPDPAADAVAALAAVGPVAGGGAALGDAADGAPLALLGAAEGDEPAVGGAAPGAGGRLAGAEVGRRDDPVASARPRCVG